MALTRRAFLQLAGLVAAGAALPGCAPLYQRLAGDPPPLAELPPLDGSDFRVLNRLTFGPTPEERALVARSGLAAWVEQQLDPESIDDSSAEWRIRGFETLAMDADQLVGLDDQDVLGELRRAALLRRIYSGRQLYEIMVEFWEDHFNISADKPECWYLLPVDNREVIRRHALGNFRDLLWASAHSPAMLIYLDNQVNHAQAPNENYARELMELHTLGVGGGYSQRDVMELARCLTGWTVKAHFWLGQFQFDQDMHDQGTKQVLGLSIAPAGQREVEQVVELLAAHPATARYLAGKLARRLVAEAPPLALVEQAAAAFLASGGEIKAILRVLLLDGLARQPELLQPKFKRPANFLISSLRMLNAESDAAALLDYLARLGQLPFGWPTPDGFPDHGEAWQGNLMPRWHWALALVERRLGNTSIDLGSLAGAAQAGSPRELVDALSGLLLGNRLPAQTSASLVETLRAQRVGAEELPPLLIAGLLASPAFQWR